MCLCVDIGRYIDLHIIHCDPPPRYLQDLADTEVSFGLKGVLPYICLCVDIDGYTYIEIDRYRETCIFTANPPPLVFQDLADTEVSFGLKGVLPYMCLCVKI